MRSAMGMLGVGLVLLGFHGMAEAEPAKSPRAVIEMAAGKIIIELYDKDAHGVKSNLHR